MKKQSYKVIPFTNQFNHISTQDLEEIMEHFEDNEFLTAEGKEFRHAFWKLFIKKD